MGEELLYLVSKVGFSPMHCITSSEKRKSILGKSDQNISWGFILLFIVMSEWYAYSLYAASVHENMHAESLIMFVI